MTEMRPKKSHIIFSETFCNFWKTLFFIGCVLLFIISCTSKDTPEKIGAIIDRSKLPKLHATDITTVISDSGITRYRISSPRWDVYDKANQPYWEFPKGIHFERFDQNLKVDANIHSQYAKFYQNEQIWELRGKVKSTNIKGELFETEHLFWNQRLEMFYSDTLVKITQATRVITGIGFQSNQSMTKYTIARPEGYFPLDENSNTNINQTGSVISPTTSNNLPAKPTNPINPQQPNNNIQTPSPFIFPIPSKK